MKKVRIEIHLTDKETELLQKIAEQQGRSRKNLCETEIRKIIQSFLETEEKNKNKEIIAAPRKKHYGSQSS